MEQQELEALTALITQKVMAQLSCPPELAQEGKKKVLVIGDDAQIPQSQRHGCIFLPLDDYETNQNILRYHRILITKLTLTQLADLALGRPQEPATCAVLHAILENIEVGIIPEALPHRKYAGKRNAALYHLYESYLQTIQVFGVKLLTCRTIPEPLPAKPAKFVAPAIERPKTHGITNAQRVITEEQALKLAVSGEVHIRADAIVTPSAQDVFAHREIRLIRDLD